MDISIRQALMSEANILTDISFKSKGYWNYPKEYFEIWQDELTITEEYIKNNIVFVAEDRNFVIGYFSIVKNERDFWAGEVFVMEGYWLEHIFILPEYIGHGIGTKLIDYARVICKDISCDKLYIFSDPNAREFYIKNGAKYIKESPSSINGRTVSLFELYS